MARATAHLLSRLLNMAPRLKQVSLRYSFLTFCSTFSRLPTLRLSHMARIRLPAHLRRLYRQCSTYVPLFSGLRTASNLLGRWGYWRGRGVFLGPPLSTSTDISRLLPPVVHARNLYHGHLSALPVIALIAAHRRRLRRVTAISMPGDVCVRLLAALTYRTPCRGRRDRFANHVLMTPTHRSPLASYAVRFSPLTALYYQLRLNRRRRKGAPSAFAASSSRAPAIISAHLCARSGSHLFVFRACRISTFTADR